MPQQKLYYDYINGELVPYIYVLTFQPCELNWDNPVFYFDAIAPFEYTEINDFDDSLISMSISISDLIKNTSYPNQLGIHLEKVKQRIMNHQVDPYVVTQFIIPTIEIEEMLQLLPNTRQSSFMQTC